MELDGFNHRTLQNENNPRGFFGGGGLSNSGKVQETMADIESKILVRLSSNRSKHTSIVPVGRCEERKTSL